MKTIDVASYGFAFSKLIVYQKGKFFYKKIKDLVNALDLSRSQKDQLIRAALSIPLNIAEGSGRNGPKDLRRFFIVARGSLFECVALIDLLALENLIRFDEAEKMLFEANEISKMLYVMAKNLNATSD